MSLTSFIRSYSTWNIHLTFFCLSHIPQQNSAKVKYHKVIFLGWVKTYCPTVPETKVNIWTEAPNYSEPKTRSCLSLWPPSPLWATGSTHHLPSHVGLQALLELSRHTPAWGLWCGLCLEAQVIYLQGSLQTLCEYYCLQEASPYHPMKIINIYL